jgi:hypothetical protein
MTSYKWQILELFADCKGVKYFVIATDGKNKVESEGNSYFADGIVNIPFEQIKESNLIDWIAKDAIKSNLEAQLKALDSDKKVEFPWLADTFTPGQ